MKKIYFLYAVASLGLGIGCSGKGAFSDQEKKAQDSIDKVSQEQGFDKLEQGKSGDTSMRKTIENPEGPDPNATKPNGKADQQVAPAGGAKPYVAPEAKKGVPQGGTTGELPGPPIQEKK